MSHVVRIVLLVIAVILAVGGSASAVTRHVANDGLDSASCGAKKVPCRSITQAVQNSADGDKVIVGPGRYGDLNSDGSIDMPGEEAGVVFCGCLVGIDRAVTITSSDGAGSTVIDGSTIEASRVVLFVANGAQFGKPGKGFTVTYPFYPGANFNAVGDGIDILGANNIVSGNIVLSTHGGPSSGFGIATLDSVVGPTLIEGNQVTGWAEGIVARGAGTTVRGNLVTGNGRGIQAGGTTQVVGNVVTQNATGIALTEQSNVTGNAIAGNRFTGVDIFNGFGGAVRKNNIVGTEYGCGLANGDHHDFVANLPADGNYWGAATGPGTAAPANSVCNQPGGSTIVAPFATKPFKVKPPKL